MYIDNKIISMQDDITLYSIIHQCEMISRVMCIKPIHLR